MLALFNSCEIHIQVKYIFRNGGCESHRNTCALFYSEPCIFLFSEIFTLNIQVLHNWLKPNYHGYTCESYTYTFRTNACACCVVKIILCSLPSKQYHVGNYPHRSEWSCVVIIFITIQMLSIHDILYAIHISAWSWNDTTTQRLS